MDRHTIAKYYRNGGKIIKKRKNQNSYYDNFQEEIIELLSQPGVSKMAVFQFLCNKYPDTFHPNYNTFKSYTLRKDIKLTKSKNVPHVRFETKPGDQLQVDWKESLSISIYFPRLLVILDFIFLSILNLKPLKILSVVLSKS